METRIFVTSMYQPENELYGLLRGDHGCSDCVCCSGDCRL